MCPVYMNRRGIRCDTEFRQKNRQLRIDGFFAISVGGHALPSVRGFSLAGRPEPRSGSMALRESRQGLLILTRISRAAAGTRKTLLDAKRALLYRTIFPQTTNWLPEDEGTQLRFEFEAELARLNAA